MFNEDPLLNINDLGYNNLYRALRFGQALSALNCMTLGARGLSKSMSARKIAKTGNALKKLHVEATHPDNNLPIDESAELARFEFLLMSELESDFDELRSACCDSPI